MYFETAAVPQEVGGDEIIPQGPPGKDGKSAYQIALDNGFEGTEEEWLLSLTGPQGETGPKGDTGEQGPQGEAGPQGEQGVDGAPATINGVNALTIEAKDGIKATQEGDTLTISGKELQNNTGAKTVTGESISVTDSVKYPLLGLNIYGKSTQDGTPSPTNPVPIVSVGDDGELKVTACGKNLLPVTIDTTTVNGITYTINSDCSITANGTPVDSTKWSSLPLVPGLLTDPSTFLTVTEGSYKLITEGSSDLSKLYAILYHRNEDNSYKIIATCKNVGVSEFSIQNVDDRVYILLACADGYAPNNETIKVSIVRADNSTDYEPYTGSTASISSVLPLCGLPVQSGGNYTDSNGQQWVCDELIYRPNGTGKVVKNIRVTIVDGKTRTANLMSYNESSGMVQWNYGVVNDFKVVEGTARGVGICSHTFFDSEITGAYSHFVPVLDGTNKYMRCWFDINTPTQEELNTWLQSNPVTFAYLLNTPEEINLTAEEMAQLYKLYSYNGVTNIFNDEQAEMSVKYCTSPLISECYLPFLERQANGIEELKAAILSAGANV